MASNSEDFVAFVEEQLQAIPGIVRSRLFGGAGLSVNGVQFALLIANTVYFVVDDSTRPLYEKMGSTCFSYATKARQVNVKRYYTVPADLLEDCDQLLPLAQQAIRIAQATSRKKSKK